MYINAAVAQLVERRTENPYVVSSILTRGKKTEIFSVFFLYYGLNLHRVCIPQTRSASCYDACKEMKFTTAVSYAHRVLLLQNS